MAVSGGGRKNTERAKSAKHAAELIKQGYPHGRRMSKPYPNSGGLTAVNRAGSAVYQRRIDKERKGR